MKRIKICFAYQMNANVKSESEKERERERGQKRPRLDSLSANFSLASFSLCLHGNALSAYGALAP